MNEEVILKVKGQAFHGWTSIMIDKSMYQITGSFGLATTDIYPGEAKKWNIILGDECIVEISNQKVITGYIEDINIDFDSENHNIQFGGRDKTGDLADCSFNEINKEWKGLSLANIVKNLCAPFKIEVVIDDSVVVDANKIINDFERSNEGDTVFDTIKDLSNMNGILPISYGDGKLTLTRAGVNYKAYDSLESGKNILDGHFDCSNKDRFQTYVVKSQDNGKDINLPWGPSGPSQSVGKSVDNIINRYRPIIIFAKDKCDSGTCQKLARWESNNRAGASRSLNYNVSGWIQSNGKVWPLNSMIQVKDKILGVNETLLISKVSFSIDERGAITNVELVHPDTFTIKPVAKEIKAGFDGLPWMKK